MSTRWRIGLAAIVAAVVIGGFVPHGALSAAGPVTQVVQIVEAPVSVPVSCVDATCGKGSPAPAAPTPGVAWSRSSGAWWPSRRRPPSSGAAGDGSSPSPRDARPPVPPASVLLARTAPRRAPAAPFAGVRRPQSPACVQEAAPRPPFRAFEHVRPVAVPASFRRTPCRNPHRGRRVRRGRPPTNTKNPKESPDQSTRTQIKNVVQVPDSRPDRTQTQAPIHPVPLPPSGPDGVGPGRAGGRRHRHHGRDQGRRDVQPAGLGVLTL